MWICPNCGEELSDKDVSFCGACGARIAAAEEVDLESGDPYGGEVEAAQYRSDETAESEYETPGAEPDSHKAGSDSTDPATDAAESPAKYWSDEEAVIEDHDDTTVDELQRDDNLIPEDHASLIEKLDVMMREAYDPDGKEIVLLKNFDSENEALLVKGLLDSEGILAMNSYNALFVRKDDLQIARELMSPDDEATF